MIEINLLPSELREQEGRGFERILKPDIAFIILIYFVGIHLLLFIVTQVNNRRLQVLSRSYQALSSEEFRINQLQAERTKLNLKIAQIEQLVNNRILWSGKLNRISDLTTSGIWLNELTIEKQTIEIENEEPEYLIDLIIRGSAASRSKDEPALIGRLMQNLKDDPYFSDEFDEIELGPIKKRLIAQTEVMDFVLTCRFKPDRVKAFLE